MKINIVKHCTAALIIYCSCVTIVTGSNILKIFRNVDGVAVEVSSKIEVPNGADLTLICQVENIKNKEMVNGYLSWMAPPKIHSQLKLKALKNASTLVIRNVNTNDEGLYVCASLKFKIFKALHLLVKQNKSAELSYLNFSRLAKREVTLGNKLDLKGTGNQSSTNPFLYRIAFLIFGLLFAAVMIYLLILACNYKFQESSITWDLCCSILQWCPYP